MYTLRTAVSNSVSLCLTFLFLVVVSVGACHQQTNDTDEGSGLAVSDASDCLPDIALVDQHGNKVSLVSLKGKPMLFDFFYTTCPGPCLMLTARMKLIANRLGPILGSKVRFVSVTVDPEHDHPSDLARYAKEQSADRDGWLFLTGKPAEIDRLMAQFKLRRQHEPDGSVDHVLEFFLVGRNGRAQLEYAAFGVNPAKIAREVEQTADGKTSGRERAGG